MSEQESVTLQDVFEYIKDVYRQSRRMVQDAVQELSKVTGCHFTHKRAWDYVIRPNEHFLYDEWTGCINSAWMTYLPEGKLQRGAVFYLRFADNNVSVQPMLCYGSVEAGIDGFDMIDRWSSTYTIRWTEERQSEFQVQFDGPLTVITSSRKNYYPRSTYAAVPLESIAGTAQLRDYVILPLAALVSGEESHAKELLAEVPIITWPDVFHEDETDDEPDEMEQV